MSHGNYQQQGPPDFPMCSAKEQTLMWQQNSYMGDSGIQSGVTTQAPSLTGKEEDEIEGDQLMFDLDGGFTQGFTQDQVDGEFEANGMEQKHIFYYFFSFSFLSFFFIFVESLIFVLRQLWYLSV